MLQKLNKTEIQYFMNKIRVMLAKQNKKSLNFEEPKSNFYFLLLTYIPAILQFSK